MTRLRGTIRSNPIKVATAILGLLAATGTAIAQRENLLWVIPVPIPYLHSTVKLAQADVIKELRNVQIDQANGKLEAAEDALDKWKLEATKAQTDEEKLRINQAIRRTQATHDKLKDQINSLQRP